MPSVNYPPPRQRGLTLLSLAAVILAAAASALGWLASTEPIGPLLMLYILLATLVFAPLPLLAYRLYSLQRGNYNLDREKLTLTWGLRVEQIPVSDIEWVRPLNALAGRLPLPVLHLPGSLVGVRRHPELGPVEFLASGEQTLLLVATAKRIFAISPQDPAAFLEALQRTIEMGSLSPAAPQSVYPSFVVAQAWDDRLARYLWLAGLLLNIGLFTWVGLLAPTLDRVPLGFLPSGEPGAAVPGVGLVLLPVVSLFFSLLGWLAGLVFYRWADRRTLAQLVWGRGVVTPLLFLLAVMFLVTAPA
jgi:hypothetical protein